MYGNIYAEVQQLYEEIKQKNPGRKDLTKTVEFMQTVEPHKMIPSYYYIKRMEQAEPCRNSPPKRTNSTPKKKNSTPRMVLNIPLMVTTKISTTAMMNTEIPSTTTTRDLEMAASPPILDQEDPTPQLEIPDHICEDLIQELRQDPELYRIFNDFNTSDHDDIDIQENVEIQYNDDEGNDDMWDSFTLQEQTPLELELSQLGY